MSERLLLISADSAMARVVRGALVEAAGFLQIHALEGDEARAGEKFQPSFVLVDSDSRGGVTTAYERIASARRQFPAVPVVAMGNEMSAQLVLTAMRAGADDFLDRDAPPDIIQAALKPRAPAPQRSTGQAAIAAILSGVPSEADRDFALNLAVKVARRAPGGMTLYIDLSLPCTEAGIALDLELGFGVQDTLREIARLDRAFLESAVARCPRTGLYVMALSGDSGSDPAWDGPGFAGLLQILRTICDVIVVGYGPYSRGCILPESAQVFLCCNQRFPSIRAAGELLRMLDGAAPQLVIHQLAPGRAPSPGDIRKVLEVTDSIDLETDWGDLAVHLNRASPLALASSRYSRALEACLARLDVPSATPRQSFTGMLATWLQGAS